MIPPAADLKSLSLLLDEALLLPEGDRLTWLERQQDLPAALRAKLESLLGSGPAYTLPPLPKYPEEAGGAAAEAEGLEASAEVGPYRLIRELGRGGMGAVWLAERSDGSLKRQVALKLPHSSLPQKQLAERFGRERDILAGLVHPHIARLYDAGVTAEGRPWLALEVVEGRPLRDYCQERALGLEARLALFQQVLAAVQYAHGQLVVHRDLKPGNILVTADGQVRLLDFGIAKLLVDGAAKETELTEMGGRVLTPQYAAPEQLLGQPIGTSADIYALGVVLYELLAETLPYRLKRDTRGELELAILEGNLVPPSQQAATAWKGRLKGDLDTIVLKALKQRPAERYATAAAFGEDIARYLKGEPVLAQPDSAGYRAKKFLARHRLGVAAAALVVVALATGLGVALWQAQVAREHAETARKEAQTAQAVKEFMQGIFLANSAQQGDPVKARQTTARELLDIGAAKIDESLNDAPEAKVQTYKLLLEMYQQVGMQDRSIEMLDRYLRLARQIYPQRSEQVIEGLGMLALLLNQQGEDPVRERAVLDELAPLLPAKGTYRATMLLLEAQYWMERDARRAAEFARQAVALMREFPDETDLPWILASAVDAADQLGETAEAMAYVEEGLAAVERQGAKDWTVTMRLRFARGRLLERGNRLHEAEADFRFAADRALQAHGPGDVNTAITMATLARLQFAAGRAGEGELLLSRARRIVGSARPAARGTSTLQQGLAVIALAEDRAGRPQAALNDLTKTIAMGEAGEGSPSAAALRRHQARLLAELGRVSEADQVLTQAILFRERAGVHDPQALAAEAGVRARLLLAQGQAAAAADLLARFADIPVALSHDDLDRRKLRVRALRAAGRTEAARTLVQDTLAGLARNPERSYLTGHEAQLRRLLAGSHG